MKIVKLVSVTFALALTCSVAQAQVGRRLQDAAGRAAERSATQQTEKRTEDAVNKAIDGALDGNNNQQQQQQQAPANPPQQQQATTPVSPTSPAETPQQGGTALEMAYAKNDFVPGDEIFFEDLMDNEQLGEFPSMWDLHRGNAEIATIDGKKVIAMDGGDSWLEPLMKTPKNYLGDVFTLEFDYFQQREGGSSGSWELDFMTPDANIDLDVFTIKWSNSVNSDGTKAILYGWTATSGRSNGSTTVKSAPGQWHHISVSFNRRALKVYYNGERIVNVPNVQSPPGWVTFWSGNGETGKNTFIKDVRFAKGAVPLYDRMLTDGKFITYGITFDVGKSTIKPESMGEINRIATLLKENPDLKFSVEGHTDSTGSAATNQTLSEARSQAVVDKLVENGIARDRLTAAGKGQSSPIADNGTDEGRAKNRRVEFVKL